MALREQFKDPYALGYRELEKWIAELSTGRSSKDKPQRAAKKRARLDIAGHQVEWAQSGDKLTLVIPGVSEDPSSDQLRAILERLIRDLTEGLPSS